jgi:hypothetical protein
VASLGDELIDIVESDEQPAASEAGPMLENTMELAYRFMEHPDYRVAEEVINLLHRFVLMVNISVLTHFILFVVDD